MVKTSKQARTYYSCGCGWWADDTIHEHAHDLYALHDAECNGADNASSTQ